jgi:DNA repair exonuclease SbcCD ATPase subunit
MNNNSLTALMAAQIYATYESALDANKKLNNDLRDMFAENQQLRKENAQLVASLMRAGAERHEIEPVLIGMGKDTLDVIEQVFSEVAQLRYALAGLKSATNMKLNKGGHSGWYCPVCRAEHRNLTELEAGLHHKPDCEYAEAVQALKGK